MKVHLSNLFFDIFLDIFMDHSIKLINHEKLASLIREAELLVLITNDRRQ